MTPRDFCYWLQGYHEVSSYPSPAPHHWQKIKDHLDLTLKEMGEPQLISREVMSDITSINPIAGAIGQTSDFNNHRAITITC